jgi:hypothetical protein
LDFRAGAWSGPAVSLCGKLRECRGRSEGGEGWDHSGATLEVG